MLGEATLDVSGTFLGEAIREVNELSWTVHGESPSRGEGAGAGQSRPAVLINVGSWR